MAPPHHTLPYADLQLAVNRSVSQNFQFTSSLDQYNRPEFYHILHKIVIGHKKKLTVHPAFGAPKLPGGPVEPQQSNCVPPPSCSSGNCCYPNGYGLWNCTCNTGGVCSKGHTYWTCMFT